MAYPRTAYYYMTPEEKKAYHLQKNKEARERKAILRGYPIRKYKSRTKKQS